MIWDGTIRRIVSLVRKFSLKKKMISLVFLHASSLIMANLSILLIKMVLKMFPFNHRDTDGNLKVKRTNMSELIFQRDKLSMLWT